MEYGDNISRQQAIDLTIGLSNDSVDFVRAGIKALPPAQPEQGWIPVAENCKCNLMDNEEVLVCQNDGQIRHAMYDDFYEKKKFVTWEEGMSIANVVAYMPLPEPYQPDAKEK